MPTGGPGRFRTHVAVPSIRDSSRTPNFLAAWRPSSHIAPTTEATAQTIIATSPRQVTRVVGTKQKTGLDEVGFLENGLVLQSTCMSQTRILEKKVEAFGREILRIRSFITSFAVEDREGTYKESFVRRIKTATGRKADRTFKDKESFLAELEQV